jgi:hypothetical protein
MPPVQGLHGVGMWVMSVATAAQKHTDIRTRGIGTRRIGTCRIGTRRIGMRPMFYQNKEQQGRAGNGGEWWTAV